MEEKVFIDGKFGKICGVLHTVDNFEEIVIIVHGFKSNKETSAKINAIELNKLGINAIRIDLDNKGESDLDFETKVTIPNYVSQVENVMDFVSKRGYKKISFIGTSFGGIVVLGFAINHPEIYRILLRAPVLDFRRHLIRKYGLERLEEFKKLGKIEYDGSSEEKVYYTFDAYETAKDFSMYDHANKINIPIKILQGDKDEAVDYKVAIELVDKFQDASLHIIKGANHKLSVNGDFTEGKNEIINFFSNKV